MAIGERPAGDARPDRVRDFRRAVPAVVGVGCAIVLVLAFEGTLRALGTGSAASDPALAAIAGAIVVLGLLLPHVPRVRRAGRRAWARVRTSPPGSPTERLTEYRIELDRRCDAGQSMDASDPALVLRRRRLGLDERDHDILALFVTRRKAASAPRPAFAAGDLLLDDAYRVVRRIGGGPNSDVYLVQDEAGKRAAVKVLPPLMSLFGDAHHASEAHLLSQLWHRNILRVIDTYDRAEAFYIVMEFAEGGSLADVLGRRDPTGAGAGAGPGPRDSPNDIGGGVAGARLAVPPALRWMRDVLAGLAAAHRAGVVHCDVKPQNILLAADGSALIADFDAAVGYRAGSPTGPARGTPLWMAPEQFRGERPTPATDVYAAGAVLYRMLAGRHYLSRLEGAPLDHASIVVQRSAVRFPDDVPAPVREWMARALAKDPADRFPDAEAALAGLPKP